MVSRTLDTFTCTAFHVVFFYVVYCLMVRCRGIVDHCRIFFEMEYSKTSSEYTYVYTYITDVM